MTNLFDIWHEKEPAAIIDASHSFEARHPFRVPLPDGCHVRFTCLETAADSAVHHKSAVVDEQRGTVYELADCIKIHNARRVNG